MTNNQMALHTYAGCSAASGTNQLGKTGTTNCNDTAGAGCTVVRFYMPNYAFSD